MDARLCVRVIVFRFLTAEPPVIRSSLPEWAITLFPESPASSERRPIFTLLVENYRGLFASIPFDEFFFTLAAFYRALQTMLVAVRCRSRLSFCLILGTSPESLIYPVTSRCILDAHLRFSLKEGGRPSFAHQCPYSLPWQDGEVLVFLLLNFPLSAKTPFRSPSKRVSRSDPVPFSVCQYSVSSQIVDLYG